MNKSKLSVSKYLPLAIAVAGTTVATSSSAAQQSWSPVTMVSFASAAGGAPTLSVLATNPATQTNVSFSAQTGSTPAPCINQSIDTLRIWESLANAALLSGKQMKITYDTCGGINYIVRLDLT